MRAWSTVRRPSVGGLLPCHGVEGEAADDQQVGDLDGLLGGVADQLGADGAELGPERHGDGLATRRASRYSPSPWIQTPG